MAVFYKTILNNNGMEFGNYNREKRLNKAFIFEIFTLVAVPCGYSATTEWNFVYKCFEGCQTEIIIIMLTSPCSFYPPPPPQKKKKKKKTNKKKNKKKKQKNTQLYQCVTGVNMFFCIFFLSFFCSKRILWILVRTASIL